MMARYGRSAAQILAALLAMGFGGLTTVRQATI